MRQVSPSPVSPRGRRRIVVVLGTACITYSVQQSFVLPALPLLREDMHTTTAWAAWLLTGFMLAGVVTSPVFGRLGDQHGKRRILLVVLCLFLAGAVGAVFAQNIATLIVCRCFQGCGIAIFPLSFSIIKDEFPPERVASGIAAVSATISMGIALGLPLGGVVVNLLNWRWLFAIAALIAATALVLVFTFVPESPVRAPAKVDIRGALLLALALSSLLVGLTQGNAWGWTSTRTLGLFALFAAALPVWVAVELRTEEPLVDVRMLARRTVLLTNSATMSNGFLIQGSLAVLIPLFVTTPSSTGYGFGASTLVAGLYLLPIGIAGIVAAPIVGRLVPRIGGPRVLTIGFVFGAAGFTWLALRNSEPWQVALGAVGVEITAAVSLSALAIVMVQAVHVHETGVATGMQAVVRAIGGVLGVQIAAAILAASETGSDSYPSERSYMAAFLISAGVAALGAIAATCIPRRSRV